MLGIDGSLEICDLKWSSLFFCSHISNLSDAPNLGIPELTSTAFISLTDIASASSMKELIFSPSLLLILARAQMKWELVTRIPKETPTQAN